MKNGHIAFAQAMHTYGVTGIPRKLLLSPRASQDAECPARAGTSFPGAMPVGLGTLWACVLYFGDFDGKGIGYEGLTGGLKGQEKREADDRDGVLRWIVALACGEHQVCLHAVFPMLIFTDRQLSCVNMYAYSEPANIPQACLLPVLKRRVPFFKLHSSDCKCRCKISLACGHQAFLLPI